MMAKWDHAQRLGFDAIELPGSGDMKMTQQRCPKRQMERAVRQSDGTDKFVRGVRVEFIGGCRPRVASGCLVAEGRVRSVLGVLGLPVADDDAGVGQGPEEVDVETFVAEPGVERLDEAVAPRFAGRNERQPDPFAGPVASCACADRGLLQQAGLLSVKLCLGEHPCIPQLSQLHQLVSHAQLPFTSIGPRLADRILN
jgi:hypothetical protein